VSESSARRLHDLINQDLLALEHLAVLGVPEAVTRMDAPVLAEGPEA